MKLFHSQRVRNWGTYPRRKEENKDLKCFALFFFFFLLFNFWLLSLFIIISSSEKSICVITATAKLAKRIPSAWKCSDVSGDGVCCACGLLFNFTAFYLNLRIYLHKNNSVGQAELSRLFQFHWSWGKDFFLNKKKKSCCVLRTGSSKSLCSLSMDHVYDHWLLLDFFFFFLEVCK